MQLKPQDFLVALKLVAWGEQRWTYARLAQELGISVSEAHACIKRGLLAGLLLPNREPPPAASTGGPDANQIPDGQVKFPHLWPPQIPPGRTTRL